MHVGVLVYEVVCAFLLDVVGVSKQPDDLVTGKRQRHEHEQRLAGMKEAETEKYGGKVEKKKKRGNGNVKNSPRYIIPR